MAKRETKQAKKQYTTIKISDHVGECYYVKGVSFVSGKYGNQVAIDTTEGRIYVSYPSQIHELQLGNLFGKEIEVYEEAFEGKTYVKIRKAIGTEEGFPM